MSVSVRIVRSVLSVSSVVRMTASLASGLGGIKLFLSISKSRCSGSHMVEVGDVAATAVAVVVVVFVSSVCAFKSTSTGPDMLKQSISWSSQVPSLLMHSFEFCWFDVNSVWFW